MSSPLLRYHRLLVLSLTMMLGSEIFAAIPVSKTIYNSYPADKTKTIKIYDKTFTPAANAEILSFVVTEANTSIDQNTIKKLTAIASSLGGDAIWFNESDLFANTKCIVSVVREKDIQSSASTVWVSDIDTVLKQQSQIFLRKNIHKKTQTPSYTLSAEYGKGICWNTNPITNGDNWSFNYRRYARSGFGWGLFYDTYSSTSVYASLGYNAYRTTTEYWGVNCSWISVFAHNKLHFTADIGFGFENSRWGAANPDNHGPASSFALANSINIGLDYIFSENFAIGLNMKHMFAARTLAQHFSNQNIFWELTRYLPDTKSSISVGLKFIFPR